MKKDVDGKKKETQSLKTFIPHPSLPIPKWKDYIAKQENKKNQLKFLFQAWCGETSLIPQGCEVIIGGFNENTVILTRHQVQNVPGLSNGNHEADTLIFAHAAYAVKEQNAKRIVIEANDMDIIVMAIYHYGHLPGLLELWVHKHTMSAVVYLPCHIISHYLETTYPDSSDIIGALLASYIITGCDTVSYPFRIGKSKH